MDVLTWQERTCTVVQPAGDLDLSSAPRLQGELDPLLDAPEAPCLIVDLTKVPFCDSVGLGLLVHTLTRVRDARGRLALVVPPGMITHLLTITNLDRHFTIYRSLDEARTAMSAGPVAQSGS
ncbi:STAS domain-containing protein [Spongiactinospora sp. TRM90649]|uniref:STAS domain-containing protein n=1 Tax=Spongiactinospora sp. TRM90649 TaxID=3031114 RepID=UPI0023F7458E|nr:STAS domain-containing protein [Spongiactinospora sp. TRM90649]MDF5751201.1 STAS domain-containing protein [Spongiactinospora sp. TRM90649]